MSYDRCMFQFFLAENRFTKTNHWIIIIFFLVCSSMMLILGQSVNNLAGVYTIAFISVMFLFAFGDLMLKYKRGKLRRASRAQKTSIFICMVGCLVALAANVTANPAYVIWFVVYYGGCAALVLLMLMRIKILNVWISLLLLHLRWSSFLCIANWMDIALERAFADCSSNWPKMSIISPSCFWPRMMTFPFSIVPCST